MSDAMRRLSATVAVAMFLSLGPSFAYALQDNAVSFTSGGGTGQDISYSMGYDFTPNTNVTVSALGFYDRDGDGLNGSHLVGIFNPSQSLVASTTVPAGTAGWLRGDAANGFFRFQSITPVTLTSGITYQIQAVTGTGPTGDPYVYGNFSSNPPPNYTGLAFDPRITVGTSYATSASILFYGQAGNVAAFDFLGVPNMIVPEPASASLLVGGLALILGHRRDRTCRRG